MKANEVKRMTKIADGLKKVKEYLDAKKEGKAVKKLESMLKDVAAKLAKKGKSPKARKPSAYSLFVKANYKKVAAANPSKRPQEIMVLLGELYKSGKGVKSASAKKSASPKKDSAKKASPTKRAAAPKKGKKAAAKKSA